jgi:hypothetical protein
MTTTEQRSHCDELRKAIALIDVAYRMAKKSTPANLERAIIASRTTVANCAIPEDFPVRPLEEHDDAECRTTCGSCGRSWDDAVITSYTPVPAARCPFETWH